MTRVKTLQDAIEVFEGFHRDDIAKTGAFTQADADALDDAMGAVWDVLSALNRIEDRAKYGHKSQENRELAKMARVVSNHLQKAELSLNLLERGIRRVAKLESREVTEATDSLSPIALEILLQLGGQGRLRTMLGDVVFHDLRHTARDAAPKTAGRHGLWMKFPTRRRSKGNVVAIAYDVGRDLYDVEFVNYTPIKSNTVKFLDGLYADQLKSVIEGQTGLHLSL